MSERTWTVDLAARRVWLGKFYIAFNWDELGLPSLSVAGDRRSAPEGVDMSVLKREAEEAIMAEKEREFMAGRRHYLYVADEEGNEVLGSRRDITDLGRDGIKVRAAEDDLKRVMGEGCTVISVIE